MPRPGYISVGGKIVGSGFPGPLPASGFYIRQGMRTSGGRIPNAEMYVDFFRHAVRTVLGMPLDLTAARLEAWAAELAVRNFFDRDVPVEMDMYLVLDSDSLLPVMTCRRVLMDDSYALQGVRPAAVIFSYGFPYPSFRTSVSDAADALFGHKAFGDRAAVAVRCDADSVLLAARSEALFAVHGKTLIATPLSAGAADSVHRHVAVAAARDAGIPFAEQEIRSQMLSRYDELMIIDALGVTSISQCGGARFMSLTARRLAEAMAAAAGGV